MADQSKQYIGYSTAIGVVNGIVIWRQYKFTVPAGILLLAGSTLVFGALGFGIHFATKDSG